MKPAPAQRALLLALAEARQLHPPEPFADGAAFSVNGVDFNFAGNANGDLLLHADFGATRPAQEPSIDYQLLRTNYIEFASCNAGFSRSTANGHVIYAQVIEPAACTVTALSELLDQRVRTVLRWREEHAAALPRRSRRSGSLHLSNT